MLVVVVHEGGDLALEAADRIERATADRLIGDQSEPAFDLVEPRAVRGREVQVKRGSPPCQPGASPGTHPTYPAPWPGLRGRRQPRLLAAWDDHSVCRARHRQWSGLHTMQTRPSPSGVPELSAPPRYQRAAAARCASDRRQLRHAQACQSEGLVRTPPALSSSLHADLRFMAQSGLSVGLV